MRTLALVSSILIAGALPAVAADLPVKARPMAPVAMAYNWTGCYIGGNVGGKWARTDDTVTIAPVPGNAGATVTFASATASTIVGGGQVGCNYQAPGSNWVFGIEGDADWHRWSTGRVLAVTVPPFVAGDSFDISSRWQASVRGRIGYAWDRWMLYVTGGAAFTNVVVGANFPIFVGAVTFPATVASESKTLFGPTLGGGLEYAITNNWSVGIEGRYSWYGNQTFNSGLVAVLPAVGGGFVFSPATQTMKIETAEVTARLNFKF
jgi:outer membrane immunogenic protein